MLRFLKKTPQPFFFSQSVGSQLDAQLEQSQLAALLVLSWMLSWNNLSWQHCWFSVGSQFTS
jgi:hypothetical protein